MSEGSEEIAPRIEVEIKVLPPEPETLMSAEEEMHAYQEQEARRLAGVHHMQTCTGIYLPMPDLTSWPERFRSVFLDELARLKAAARPPVG